LASQRKRYQDNPDYWRKYAREAMRRRYWRDPEAERRRTKQWRDTHPEAVIASCAVVAALREGRLIQQPCEVCGSIKTDGHHDDYSKPLDVRWLCRRHHKQLHCGWSMERMESCHLAAHGKRSYATAM